MYSNAKSDWRSTETGEPTPITKQQNCELISTTKLQFIGFLFRSFLVSQLKAKLPVFFFHFSLPLRLCSQLYNYYFLRCSEKMTSASKCNFLKRQKNNWILLDFCANQFPDNLESQWVMHSYVGRWESLFCQNIDNHKLVHWGMRDWEVRNYHMKQRFLNLTQHSGSFILCVSNVICFASAHLRNMNCLSTTPTWRLIRDDVMHL